MVIGYVEKRVIDLRYILKEFSFLPDIEKFTSSSVKFDQFGLADYNMFDVQHLAEELIPLFTDNILETVFDGDESRMKLHIVWLLVNNCCVSVIDVVEA